MNETGNKIKYVSEEERIKLIKYVNEYDKKYKRKRRVSNSIIRWIKYSLYSPLAITTSALSKILKITGSITAICIPYGIYCIYKTIIQLQNGIELKDIKQAPFVCLFVIFPFIAFSMSFIFQRLSEYFHYHK